MTNAIAAYIAGLIRRAPAGGILHDAIADDPRPAARDDDQEPLGPSRFFVTLGSGQTFEVQVTRVS